MLVNERTQTVMLSLNSKQVVVQSMHDLNLISVVTFVNMAGSLGTPFTQNYFGFIIP
jgi:hypothetical protein